MIQIINTSGLILELLPSTSITVERNNALFSAPDKFVQDITYPSKAGLTENNIEFIKGGHLVEADNGVYEQPVRLIVAGSPFFACIFRYKISSGQIDYTLKVNFGMVADKVKNTSIRQIITLDADTSIANNAAMETRMKNSCLNPLAYPYVFAPVKNDKWIETSLEIAYPWINYWDHAAQQFRVSPGAVPDKYSGTVQAPFFRVSYILKRVLECLKFNVEGGYFSDEAEQVIYFFTRIGLRQTGAANKIMPSLSYMPDMKIAEFLKQLADRRKISFEFDALKGSVLVETPTSVLNSPETEDIREYIESIQQIEVPESKGYEITLKIDETDDAWNTGTADEKIFSPPQKLHIGQSETKIEMKIGALNFFEDEEYSYPINKQKIETQGTETITEWQLTLLKYTGMKDLGGGNQFPEAKPLELTTDDALWYKFLNDSKPITIIANIPPHILARMKPTKKLICVSEQGNVFTAMPERISYQLTNRDTELIKVKIEAWQIISRFTTPVYMEVVVPEQAGKRYIRKFTAYFDPQTTGMTQLYVQRVPLGGSPATFGYVPITKSTDNVGIGGSIGMSYAITGSRIQMQNSEDRLFSAVAPKYYIKNGVKGYFTAVSNYYTFDALPGSPSDDNKPCWIVF